MALEMIFEGEFLVKNNAGDIDECKRVLSEEVTVVETHGWRQTLPGPTAEEEVTKGPVNTVLKVYINVKGGETAQIRLNDLANPQYDFTGQTVLGAAIDKVYISVVNETEIDIIFVGQAV